MADDFFDVGMLTERPIRNSVDGSIDENMGDTKRNIMICL